MVPTVYYGAFDQNFRLSPKLDRRPKFTLRMNTAIKLVKNDDLCQKFKQKKKNLFKLKIIIQLK